MLLVLVVAVSVAAGEPAPAAGAFRQATQAMAAGDFAGAAARFERLADSDPAGALADDALMKAAQLWEERLADPAHAAALYRRVLTQHPGSRFARRAQRRLELLSHGLGETAEDRASYAAYRDILYGAPSRGVDASIAAMERLLRADPSFPLAPDARLWLGQAYAREGRDGAALAWLRRVQQLHPDTDAAWFARKAEADLLASRGDHAAAERVYRALPGGDTARAHAVANALARLDRYRTRARWQWVAWVLIAGFMLALPLAIRRSERSWRAVGRGLARPPIEIIYMVPIAVLFALAAATSNQWIGRAVGIILVGSLAVTWLSGAALRAHRRRANLTLARATVHALAAAACIIAICYLAVTREHVLDFVLETWRQGHER